MRILHTSDWHLGRMLLGLSRQDEHDRFLDWLAVTLRQHAVDVLLVAGDVFDTTTPPHGAQRQYFAFLDRVAGTICRHVVIIAGNHDSPSFLEAPQGLLRSRNVHVVGLAQDPADHVLVLEDACGSPELIVCAVPYLRDGDIRTVTADEGIADKEHKRTAGIRRHYEAVTALAREKRQALGGQLPMVAMGHLFTTGGRTIEGDGVRELYVGALGHVSASLFDPCFDYVALGHLHVPQQVGDSGLIRYSGSPLPMGFAEAEQQKSVCLITLSAATPRVELLDIPRFRTIKRIRGDWAAIEAQLEALNAVARQTGEVLLEVIYDGPEILGDHDLGARLEGLCGPGVRILAQVDMRRKEALLAQGLGHEGVDALSEQEVFARLLEARNIPQAQRCGLEEAFLEILREMHESAEQGGLGENPQAAL